MDHASLVTACVLWLSVLSAVLWQTFGLQRQVRVLRHSLHLLTETVTPALTAPKPSPTAGTSFCLSDQEMAKREQVLMASSRARAQVLASDARQKLIRTSHPGSWR